MTSTYSPIKVELIATGEQSGTWGATTNVNLGTALEEAIVGRATANFTTDADLTLTLVNLNTTQVARNYILNVTSGVALTATRNLIVPTIDKPYIVENNTTGSQSIIVKTSAGTGVTIPNGKKAMVYANSTNVVSAFDYVPTINIGALTSSSINISTITSGSVLFAGTSGLVSQDNSNLYWDDTNNRLGIGTATPTASLHITGTGTGLLVNPTNTTSQQIAQIAGTIAWDGSTANNAVNISTVLTGGATTTTALRGILLNTTYTPSASITQLTNMLNQWSLGTGTTPTVVYSQNTNAILAATALGGTITTIYGHSVSFSPNASATTNVTNFFCYSAANIANGTAQTVTSAYGFISQMASGTGRWGFYSSGTANNAFNGNVRFGGVTAPTVPVDVTGAIAATSTITGGSFIPTSATIPTNGMYLSAADTLSFSSGSTQRLQISASGVTVDPTTTYPIYINTGTTGNNFIATSGALLSTGGSASRYNVLVGPKAGANIYTLSQSQNTFIGYASGENIISGGNVGVGYQALQGFAGGAASGTFNIAIGDSSANQITYGFSNIFIGSNAGYNITGGSSNITIGGNAGHSLTTATNNIFIGSAAGYYVDGSSGAGRYNVFIGNNAGLNVTTGQYNVIIGGYTGTTAPISATGSNNIVLSDGSGTIRETIDSAGNTYLLGGNFWQYCPNHTDVSVATTLSIAQLQAAIIKTTGTTYTVTLPTGTAIDAGFPAIPSVDIGFDFNVINTASGTITIAIGSSGMNSYGSLTIPTNTSAHFRLRRYGVATYTLYRLG